MQYQYEDKTTRQCPKCGEEMSQTFVGDEVLNKCEDCGWETGE